MYLDIRERFEKKFTPEALSGCWLWTAHCGTDGYGVIRISRTMTTSAHRIAYHLYVGEIPDGKWVLHRCDVRSCVNPAHLFIGTHNDNIQDMVKKGRHSCGRGEKAATGKLRNEQVLQIRSDNRSEMEIAKEYGISYSNVRRIKTNKIWKWL